MGIIGVTELQQLLNQNTQRLHSTGDNTQSLNWNIKLLQVEERHVISAPSLSTFRQRVKTFLFQASFPDIIIDPHKIIPHLHWILNWFLLLGPLKIHNWLTDWLTWSTAGDANARWDIVTWCWAHLSNVFLLSFNLFLARLVHCRLSLSTVTSTCYQHPQQWSRDGVIQDCPRPRRHLEGKNLWPWTWKGLALALASNTLGLEHP